MMVIVERKEEMRERMLGGPVPRRGQSMSHTPQYSRPTLHLRPFDHDHAHHVLNGYAYTKFAHQRRRPPHAQFEYPKASQQPCGPGASPDQLTSLIQYRRPSSHLALRTREHVPRTAAAAGYGHGHDRRFEV